MQLEDQIKHAGDFIADRNIDANVASPNKMNNIEEKLQQMLIKLDSFQHHSPVYNNITVNSSGSTT